MVHWWREMGPCRVWVSWCQQGRENTTNQPISVLCREEWEWHLAVGDLSSESWCSWDWQGYCSYSSLDRVWKEGLSHTTGTYGQPTLKKERRRQKEEGEGDGRERERRGCKSQRDALCGHVWVALSWLFAKCYLNLFPDKQISMLEKYMMIEASTCSKAPPTHNFLWISNKRETRNQEEQSPFLIQHVAPFSPTPV